MSIREHLPPDYLAPCGFDLAAFAPTASGWTTTAYDEHGDRVDYTLAFTALDDGSATADVTPRTDPDAPQTPHPEPHPEPHPDAHLEPLQHPFRRAFGIPAPLADWVDAIAMADGAGRRANNQGGWARDTLDAAVDRAAHSIVGYTDSELSTNDPEALRTWLERALDGTQVRVEVARVVELPPPRGDVVLLQRHEDGATTGWLPVALSTECAPEAWLGQPLPSRAERTIRLKPYVSVQSSGSARIWFGADHVVSWTELQERTTVSTDLTDAEWLVVRVEGTDTALVFPCAYAHLSVRTDDDGALVTLTAESAERCEAHHRRRAEFERHWGGWLDPTTPLSDDDLRAGVSRAASLVDSLLSKDAHA